MTLSVTRRAFVECRCGVSSGRCAGELISHRTTDGICNDIRNPLMGSAGTLFARNSQFETTFPRLGLNEMVATGTATGWGCSSPTRR